MIAKSLFGTTADGQKVFNYTFTDSRNQRVVMSEYACAILETNILARDNNFYDVTLGYDSLNEYLCDTRNFGATIGRYANRIAKGMFTLNGVTYHLAINNGPNTLHGGLKGFGKRLFSSELQDDCVIFRLHSTDLDEGFPGNFELGVKVSFTDGELLMQYEYICDKDTPANITNHNYFNLNGHGRGTILNHELFINSNNYCRGDYNLLALAPVTSVEGTPFDFRQPKRILDGILSYSQEIINARGGYDHCFEIANHDKPCAAATGDLTGITLTVNSDMPALQFYSGNMIGHTRGKNGTCYNTHDGFALECQNFPNAVNEPSFPDAIIKAGQLNKAFISYKFSC
ncbi:MAG: galactose mutarotase [Synergistaceae bacterium]|nr:galactose mutarotase [Synergistaceae bacterium]